jgi:hypothetical protein
MEKIPILHQDSTTRARVKVAFYKIKIMELCIGTSWSDADCFASVLI